MPTNGVYKLLIIDDNIPVIRIIQQSLARRPQFAILTSYDAEGGLVLVESEKPDLILLDINLPRMNGFQACKLIKKINPVLPVIIITGELGAERRLKAYEAGADDFLEKPFSMDQLVSHIRYYLHLSSLDH